MRKQLPRLGRDLGVIIGLAWIGAVGTGVLGDLMPGYDAHAYWLTRSGDLYGQAHVGTTDAYLYSPAFAQLISPAAALPWTAFITAWTALLVGTYLWLTGPLAVPLLLLWPAPFEIHEANIHVLLAGMLVVSERWPAAWAFGLLTKVTPGIGLIWYAVRREWRALAIALGTTAGISVVSFALAPEDWRTWVGLLTQGAAVNPTTPNLPLPLLPRLLAAALLVAWGARANRRWVLPVAVTLALPVVWVNSLAVLLALVPAARRRFGLEVSSRPVPSVPRLATAGTGQPRSG